MYYEDSSPSSSSSPLPNADELLKIFESFGVRVRVDDAPNGDDDKRTMSVVALNDDGSEEAKPRTQPHKELDIFADRTCKNSKHSKHVHATGRMLLDSGTRTSIAEYLERTDGQEVSSWGVFSFCIILWQKHLSDKRNNKILDEMLRGEKNRRTMDMISLLPEEARGVSMKRYVDDEIEDQKYRKRNQQLSNAAKTLLKIVCFFVLIYFIVEKLVPIGNTLFDTANVTAEAARDAAEAVKQTTQTGKEGVFVINNIVRLVTRVGDDVTTNARNLWTAWFWNSDKTENAAIEKMFIVGSGQSEKERLCFLDFLTEIHEFVEEEIRSIFPHWIPYVSKATTQNGKTTYESRHVYFSSMGRANVAAEAFLDALNAWNARSDNNKLSPHECPSGQCSATAPITVEARNYAVDTPQDLDMVRRMSNVSVAYGEGTSVQHWNPLDPAQFANVEEVEEVTDTATESMKSAAWEKIREGYARLKKSAHNRPGWYYLLTFAELKKQDVLMFYEVKDIEGNVATVPVLCHSPEMTVQHTHNGRNATVKRSNELERLFDVSSYIQNENGAEFAKIRLLNDSLRYDVHLQQK